MKEYKELFNLTLLDLNKNIISFGDRTSSFNIEMTEFGIKCTSVELETTRTKLIEKFLGDYYLSIKNWFNYTLKPLLLVYFFMLSFFIIFHLILSSLFLNLLSEVTT